MSASNSKIKIRLVVETKDETADIYVIDSFFRVVERGRGIKQIFEMKPGIYTVKVRVGFESREKDFVLIDKPETATFDAIEFPSAIPLVETARTHEYHIDAAERESQIIHLKKGEGSWIFVFARDWKPSDWNLCDSEKQIQTTSLPHKGLTLKGANGEIIADIEKKAICDNSLDAWAACNVEVNPGQYRLSVEIDSDKTIEQTVVACRGWQTQIFLLQKNYDYKKTAEARRADLTNTGILMSRGRIDAKNQKKLIGELNGQNQKMFDAQNPKMRLLDLARLGLTNSRQILPNSDIDRILHGKFENPMLGILGAYLLLKGKKTRLKLLKIVVENLRRILGEGTHPDVEALALRVKNKTAVYNFDLPPMLRQSWIQVVNSTARNADLISLESFAGQNAEQMLGDEPWLLYLLKNEDAVTMRQAIDESVRYLVSQQLSREKESLISQPRIPHRMPLREEKFRDMNFAPGSDLMSGQEETFEETAHIRSIEFAAESVPMTVDDKTINNLVSDMGLPKAKIIQILSRLES